MRNTILNIGVGRFRILGGQGLEYWGGLRGAKFPAGTGLFIMLGIIAKTDLLVIYEDREVRYEFFPSFIRSTGNF